MPESIVPRSPRRRRARSLAVAALLLAAGPLAWVGWSEWDPAMIREAEAAYRRGDPATAWRKASEHLARRPSSRAGASVAARSLTRLGKPAQAEPYYDRAGEVSLDDLHARALALAQAGLSAEAARACRAILADRPDDALALRRLAAALITTSRWDEALDAADRLTRLPGAAVVGHTLAGTIHHDTESPERAVLEFERVLELDPGLEKMPLSPRPTFWIYLGQDLLHVGRGADARRLLERAVAEREDAYLMDLIGESCAQIGEAEEAEGWWRRSIALKPRRALPWILLGNLELRRNRPGPAIEAFGRAAELRPGPASRPTG